MRVLLDTHAFRWRLSDRREMAKRARGVISKGANECHVSPASCWEMARKVSIGKSAVDGSLERIIPERLAANAFGSLAIGLRHVLRTATLPFHHRDPFDRRLVAQALVEDMAVVSCDGVFDLYDVKRVW